MSDPVNYPHPVIDGTPLTPGEGVFVISPTDPGRVVVEIYRGATGPRLARVGPADKPRVVGFSAITGRVIPVPSPGIPTAVSAARLRAIVDDFRPLATTDALREILARLEAL